MERHDTIINIPLAALLYSTSRHRPRSLKKFPASRISDGGGVPIGCACLDVISISSSTTTSVVLRLEWVVARRQTVRGGRLLAVPPPERFLLVRLKDCTMAFIMILATNRILARHHDLGFTANGRLISVKVYQPYYRRTLSRRAPMNKLLENVL